MSEENTAETNGSRSFEERVFARFDAVDNRLNVVDMRIEKLENKQYDTRPIWEQVLGRLDSVDTRLDSMDTRLDSMDTRLDSVDTRLDSFDGRFEAIQGEFATVKTRFDSIDARFAQLDIDLDDGFRGIERKMDVLNQYFLDARADHRYLDRRLEKLEEKTKDL